MSAQRIHGITPAMLRGQPQPLAAFAAFRAFIGQSPLVAHNAAFDRVFIRNEFGRLGWNFPNRMQCTLSLSRRVLPDPPDHRLETIFRHLVSEDAVTLQLHRALDVARATARMWLKMKKRMADMQDMPIQANRDG